MRPHALPSHGLAGVPSRRATMRWPLLRFVLDRYLLLPLGVVVALVWANAAGESYFRIAHALAFPVNEIGMALFLALIAQETLETVMPGGALHTWRRWGMPLVGAAGGMLGAAFVFLTYVYWSHEQVLAQAWPIALSIDIAAAYYVAKLIFRRPHPLAFLLLLAAATDAVGLLLLATWKPVTPEHLRGAVPLLAAVASAAMMRRARVRSPWPYLAVSGTLSWWGCYLAGAHAALALLPVVPFLPREPRTVDAFAEAADDDALHHAEHEWHEAVQVVLFLFGVVNGGVLLNGYDTGTWAILAAALVGRPLGILAAVALARPAGLHLPRGVDWKVLTVIAFATSSGFTLALFFAPALLPPGAVLQQIKMGTLATAGGAVIAFAIAALLRAGRLGRKDAARVTWHTH